MYCSSPGVLRPQRSRHGSEVGVAGPEWTPHTVAIDGAGRVPGATDRVKVGSDRGIDLVVGESLVLQQYDAGNSLAFAANISRRGHAASLRITRMFPAAC